MLVKICSLIQKLTFKKNRANGIPLLISGYYSFLSFSAVVSPSGWFVSWRLTQGSSFLWIVFSLRSMEYFVIKLPSCPCACCLNGTLQERWVESDSFLALDPQQVVNLKYLENCLEPPWPLRLLVILGIAVHQI